MSSPLLLGIIAALCLASTYIANAEPISLCEKDMQNVADKHSCTRFHICKVDENGEFTTDISICTANKVFDMVTSSCQDVGTGYLQDPAGCTTFYGCHKARANSEGYIRRHFKCPGQLRFHPRDKHCTFKTMVPDKLCNSKTSFQQIIDPADATRAPVAPAPTTTSSTTTTTTTTTTSTTTPAPTTSAAADAGSSPSTGSGSTPPARDAGVAATASKSPSSVEDIERITQVIKGQLLNRRPVINNKPGLDSASTA